MDRTDQLFRAALNARGLRYLPGADRTYEVELNGRTLTVSLENLRRNLERDNDTDAVERFIDGLQSSDSIARPAWKEVRPFIRYSIEPSCYESGFEGVFTSAINEELNQVYVYTDPDGSRITWINESDLEDWNVSAEELVLQAESNMAALVRQAKLEVDRVDDNVLGMLSTEETPFKASLILSPAFRQLVESEISWPAYVVAPCRDFVYVLQHDNREFLGRLGKVVVREYRESGYPITRDVLEVSDDGIRSIGTYPDAD